MKILTREGSNEQAMTITAIDENRLLMNKDDAKKSEDFALQLVRVAKAE